MDSFTTGQRGSRKSKRKSSRKTGSVQDGKSTTLAAVSDQAAGRGSGRPGRKREKTAGVAVALAESAKALEQEADIAMIPPSNE